MAHFRLNTTANNSASSTVRSSRAWTPTLRATRTQAAPTSTARSPGTGTAKASSCSNRVRFFLRDEKPQVIASHVRRAGLARSRWLPRADASVLANSEVAPEETHLRVLV